MINLLHIPEGVRDIYGTESLNKSKIEAKILKCMHKYGYTDVETPTFEYFDIFNKERGTVPSKDMYKFFDKEGNTLVLRPDITPAIARTAAKYYKDCKLPVHLCYRAKQFINYSGLQGKLKQTTQVGAELYNDDSVYADLELIILTIEALKECGVKEFQLEIGIADFYKGIVEQAGITEEQEEVLKEILEQKNIFALEDFAGKLEINASLKKLLGEMAELYGQIDIFDRIAEYSSVLNKKSLEAIERLKELYSLIDSYGYAKYISFDLSMLSKYSYYTGVFFRAITYGSGEPIAYGGRYDNLVKQFGLDVPAIGMSITVDYVLMGLERENILPEIEKNTTLLIFNEAASEKAIKKARELRANGKDVKLIFDKTGERLQAVKEHEKLSENGQLNKFTNELEFFKVSDVIIMED